MSGDSYCRDASISAGEQIEGSAVESTWAWMLVEHAGPWEAKALAGLPLVLRAPLAAVEATIPGARVQLIRRDAPRDAEVGPTLMWGDSRPGRAWLRRLHLSHLDALGELDLPGLLSDRAAGEPVRRPVLLVCTHGKRDRCCARYGLELYRAMVQDPRIDVWQTTHLGGHRFAATAVHLPQGLCYGRLDHADAAPLAEAVVAGRLYRLDRFRGRTAHGQDAQVAEHHLREELGDMDPASLPLLEASEVEGTTRLRFGSPGGPLDVGVTRAGGGPPRPKSCGEPASETVRLSVVRG